MSYKQILDNASAQQEQKIINDDYIGENGLLYCCKCNTPKQGEYKMPWGVVRPYILCECATEKRDREAEQHAREQRILDEQARLKFLRSMDWREIAITEISKMICPEAKEELKNICFPVPNMRNWTFANDDGKNPQLTGVMKNYVENFEEMQKHGQGLLLFGDVSLGKTRAAAMVANELLDRGYTVLFTDFKRIANVALGKLEGKQEYFDSFNRFDLLILDDLATERKTGYVNEIVLDIINNRCNSGLPMIITTNLTGEELKKPQDMANKRVYDRAMEKCFPYEVKGVNRRHQQTAENYADLKTLFGL